MGVANVDFTFGVNSAWVVQNPSRLHEPSLSGRSFPKCVKQSTIPHALPDVRTRHPIRIAEDFQIERDVGR